jgi:hypothetical protein
VPGQRFLQCAFFALVCAAVARGAGAAELAHYYKAFSSLTQSTPQFQGWALNPGTIAGTHVLKGAASPYYAWRVTDANAAPQSFNPGYASEVGTHPAWDDAATSGWRYTTTARYLTAVGQGPNAGIAAYVNNREYNILLSQSSAGALQATLYDETTATFELSIATNGVNEFHKFQLRSVPGTELVQLFFDDQLVNQNYAWNGVSNTSHAVDTVHWGNGNRAGAALGVMDYHEIAVEVGPFSALAGDFNEDLQVNGSDLGDWMDGVGTTNALHEDGDADGDRDVDGADFLVWQRQVGQSGTASLMVSEPSTAAGGLAGALVLLVMRRRWSRKSVFGFMAMAAAMVAGKPMAAADAAISLTEHGAAVTLDDQPFAEYLIKSGHQPVVWPIVGPSGQAMTRQYPLGPKLGGEKEDHPHHRSLWFNHGSVNGLDFWVEPNLDAPQAKDNQIVHRQFAKMESRGDVAKIVTLNDWLANGVKVCEDKRTFAFGADEHGRWIDAVIDLRASEGELVLGDTKEGCFGLRVAGTMDVDAKLGGRIVNSRGLKNEAAWGRAAEWVDYHGLVDDQPVGIAVFDMPDSLRYPCRWHVRTYGLFAANPLGDRDFPPGDAPQGAVKVAKGDSLRFHYRVLFYAGELTPEELTEIGREYGQSSGVEAK